MSRRIEQVAVQYVPLALGIRDEYLTEKGGDDDPVTITIRPLTAGEYRGRTAAITLTAERGAIVNNSNKVNQKLVKDCVILVENYEYKDEDTGLWTEITNGSQLWANGELAIVSEVLEVIPEFSQLKEGEKKKLHSQRVGSSASTQAAAETPA